MLTIGAQKMDRDWQIWAAPAEISNCGRKRAGVSKIPAGLGQVALVL